MPPVSNQGHAAWCWAVVGSNLVEQYRYKYAKKQNPKITKKIFFNKANKVSIFDTIANRQNLDKELRGTADIGKSGKCIARLQNSWGKEWNNGGYAEFEVKDFIKMRQEYRSEFDMVWPSKDNESKQEPSYGKKNQYRK